jgi:hypothetical protein
MGSISITHSVTGVIDGRPRGLQSSARHPVLRVSDASKLVGASWTDVATTEVLNQFVLLHNKGSNPAIYRVKTGATYTVFPLPANGHVMFRLNQLVPTGTEVNAGVGTPYAVQVYSALGTTIYSLVVS